MQAIETFSASGSMNHTLLQRAFKEHTIIYSRSAKDYMTYDGPLF